MSEPETMREVWKGWKRGWKGLRRSLYPIGVDLAQLAALHLKHEQLAKLARAIARLGYLTLYPHRDTALANLQVAFGKSLPHRRRKAIVIGMFENLILGMMEYLRLERMDSREIMDYVDMRGWEHLEWVRRLGRGGILVTGHMGNWELAAACVALKGYPMNVVARRIYIEKLNNRLVRMRERNGVKTIYRNASMRSMIRCLRRNEFLGILPDQDVRKVGGIFVDFFGRPAYTPVGPALLSVATGAPLLTARDERVGPRHRISIDPPIFPDQHTPRQEEVRRLVALYTRRLEEFIRKRPDQWVWIHRRWRTRPQKIERGHRPMDGDSSGTVSSHWIRHKGLHGTADSPPTGD